MTKPRRSFTFGTIVAESRQPTHKGDTEGMRIDTSVVIMAVTAAVFGMSLSGVQAQEKETKAAAPAKTVKGDAVKPAAAAKVVKDEAFKISNSFTLIKEIAAIPKKKIPADLLQGAGAIAIFPKAAKRDFMVSGESAGGVLLVHNGDGAWSSPVFITLSGGTLGWQAVSEPMDIILVIKSKKHVDTILQGKLAINARIPTEPGRLGPSMKAATVKEQKAEISSYLRTRGAFVEESTLGGTTIQIDAAANDKFYATPKVAVADIVSGTVVKSTEDIKALQKLLADYAAVKLR